MNFTVKAVTTDITVYIVVMAWATCQVLSEHAKGAPVLFLYTMYSTYHAKQEDSVTRPLHTRLSMHGIRSPPTVMLHCCHACTSSRLAGSC
jgi:hypothetical protein